MNSLRKELTLKQEMCETLENELKKIKKLLNIPHSQKDDGSSDLNE